MHPRSAGAGLRGVATYHIASMRTLSAATMHPSVLPLTTVAQVLPGAVILATAGVGPSTPPAMPAGLLTDAVHPSPAPATVLETPTNLMGQQIIWLHLTLH